MHRLLPVLSIAASLAACGGGGEGSADTTLAAIKVVPGIKVFKSMDSRQCSGGGVSLAGLQAQLAAANVQVQVAECANDGWFYPAVCGGADGRIGVFEIPAEQVPAANAAGFKSLATLPRVMTISCS